VIVDASRPHAGSPDAQPVARISRPLGIQTNNYAEYTGVILALEKARSLGAREVELVLDSMLIVEQLSGRWKVKHPGIKPLVAQAQELLAGFDRWSIRHERRENNIQADALANLALDDPAAARAAEAGSGVIDP
jgi:ribonuclease HI